jgi:hypothetical protein
MDFSAAGPLLIFLNSDRTLRVTAFGHTDIRCDAMNARFA